jgi:lipid A ethanolaminephosphotransferase
VIGSKTLSLLTALYILAVFNITFWKKIHAYLWAYPFTIAALYVGIFALFSALLVTFSVKYLMKPLFAILIVGASSAAWFMDQFGAVIDKDMIRNVFETTSAEANGLVTKAVVLHLLFTAVIPVLLLFYVKIRHQNFPRKLLANLALVGSCLIVVLAIGFTNSKAIASAVRQHKDIVKSLNPITPLISTVGFFLQQNQDANLPVAALGLDAKLAPAVGDTPHPRVTIIIAGETARSRNFSLNGYERETNPELKKRDVTYFPDTESCGTATATSLPCMFSKFRRKDYSHDKGVSNENVLDVLTHAGVDVAWYDNDSGSKTVADRITFKDLTKTNNPAFCVDGECRDAVFLSEIENWLSTVKKDSVLVVHTIGSHGPSYFKRYSDEERGFTPDCRTPELSACTTDDIRNAYDNTILATDAFIAKVIDTLKAHEGQIEPSMLYVSDHGESLGESGMYLHGTPYIFAPYEQTHVPMLLWMSDRFAKGMSLDQSCLKREAAEGGKSHDYLFHSILSMMNVSTSVYDPKLDLYASCKQVAS